MRRGEGGSVLNKRSVGVIGGEGARIRFVRGARLEWPASIAGVSCQRDRSYGEGRRLVEASALPGSRLPGGGFLRTIFRVRTRRRGQEAGCAVSIDSGVAPLHRLLGQVSEGAAE